MTTPKTTNDGHSVRSGKTALSARSARAGIIWLVVLHVLVGLLLGAITAAARTDLGLLIAITAGLRHKQLVGTFIGLVLSQASLLGIWAGSGTNRSWIRLVGVLVGVGYLGRQSGICISVNKLVLLVAFATLIVTAVLLLIRCFGFRIRFDSDQEPRATKMQFSIRQIMLLTLVVGCLLALAKCLQPHLDPDDWSFLVGLVVNKLEVGRFLVGHSKLGEPKVELLAIALAPYVGVNVLAEHHPLRPPVLVDIQEFILVRVRGLGLLQLLVLLLAPPADDIPPLPPKILRSRNFTRHGKVQQIHSRMG